MPRDFKKEAWDKAQAEVREGGRPSVHFTETTDRAAEIERELKARAWSGRELADALGSALAGGVAGVGRLRGRAERELGTGELAGRQAELVTQIVRALPDAQGRDEPVPPYVSVAQTPRRGEPREIGVAAVEFLRGLPTDPAAWSDEDVRRVATWLLDSPSGSEGAALLQQRLGPVIQHWELKLAQHRVEQAQAALRARQAVRIPDDAVDVLAASIRAETPELRPAEATERARELLAEVKANIGRDEAQRLERAQYTLDRVKRGEDTASGAVLRPRAAGSAIGRRAPDDVDLPGRPEPIGPVGGPLGGSSYVAPRRPFPVVEPGQPLVAQYQAPES